MGWLFRPRTCSKDDAGPSGRPTSSPPPLWASRSRDSTGGSMCSGSTSTLEDFYELHEPLGAGAFATVHRAVERSTGRTVAVKLTRRRSSASRHSAPLPGRAPSPHDEAEREYNLNCRLHRKQAAKQQDLFAAPHAAFATDTEYAMVIDYLGGGSLEQWVAAHGEVVDGRRVLREADAKVAISRCLSGIRAMRAASCAHCDIKPANLVLGEPGDLSSLRIVDFGLAKETSRSGAAQNYRGTPQYFAPELVRAFRWGRPFGPAVDVWAAGVTMYVLLSGELPFAGDTCEGMFRAILGAQVEFIGPVWDRVSKDAKDLIRKLLEKDEGLRVKPRAALRHAWFRDLKTSKCHLRLPREVLRRMLSPPVTTTARANCPFRAPEAAALSV
mmetsp:Transcript_22202/g.56901  ORF Transcript_22202/g.56901 Transcript_22202/m.56901 type:complete len:385 (+) Transcript_22202:315-1469(+)